MFFQRYYLNCLAHASYMVADPETKVAAVIDPQRDVDQYLADAEEHGFQIKYVFLTHFHADFVAGHIELRDRAGAKIYLGEKAQAEYEFTPVKDGDVVEFGGVRLSILETPGHTPEGISILIFDLTENERAPRAVLTGDTLFIGDVGRPDLLASIGVTEDELANMLYESLHSKLLALPDETLVYPAHGAGSMCGKSLSDAEVSKIGEQRKYNYALQPMSQEEFRKLVTAEQPEAPGYFVHDAILNRQDRGNLQDAMDAALVPIPLADVLEQSSEVQIVDTRDPLDFAGAHLKGSLNIPLDGKYATWCGTLLDKERPIIVVADEGRESESIMRLGRIGFDGVRGYLAKGVEALDDRPELVAKTSRITVKAVADRQDDSDLLLVDVRNPAEWNAGHISGSINMPLNHLRDRAEELPRDRQLAVQCRTGYRSSIAASLLQGLGFSNVVDVVGGIEAWETTNLPVVEGESSCKLSQARG